MRRAAAQLSRAAIFAGASACWTAAAPTTTGGGSAPENGTENRTGPGSVRGRVYQDNRPIAGITVYLEGADGSVRQTSSGPDGAYEFADVPAGEYHATTRTAPTRSRRFRGDDAPEKPPYQKLAPGQELFLEIIYYVPEPRPMDMPYGAPPARRRSV